MKTIMLESLINFGKGDIVMLNPDNHGYHNSKIRYYEKNKNKLGEVIRISGTMIIVKGIIRDPTKISYKRLIIIKKYER